VSHVDKPAQRRGPETIEHEIEETRERLAGTIDQLVVRTNPKNVAKREVASVKGKFVDPQGQPRTDNIVKVAAAVVGFVALVVVLRKVAS